MNKKDKADKERNKKLIAGGGFIGSLLGAGKLTGAYAKNVLFKDKTFKTTNKSYNGFTPNTKEHYINRFKKQIDKGSKRIGLKEKVHYSENLLGKPGKPVYGNAAYAYHPLRQRHEVYSNPRASRAILYHELGHAKNWESIPKALRTPLMIASNLTSLAGTAGAAALLSKGKDDKKQKYAAPAFAAGFLPRLADEGIASIRAVKALRGAGKLPLAKAFGSYLGIPTVGALGIEATRRIKNKYD